MLKTEADVERERERRWIVRLKKIFFLIYGLNLKPQPAKSDAPLKELTTILWENSSTVPSNGSNGSDDIYHHNNGDDYEDDTSNSKTCLQVYTIWVRIRFSSKDHHYFVIINIITELYYVEIGFQSP